MTLEKLKQIFSKCTEEYEMMNFAPSTPCKYKCEVHCRLPTRGTLRERCNYFVDFFARKTDSAWNQCMRMFSGNMYDYCKYMVCAVPGCTASICVKFVKPVLVLKKGLDVVVDVNFCHTHEFRQGRNWRSAELKRLFMGYFSGGMSVEAARAYHELKVIESQGSSGLANPSLQEINELYASWKQINRPENVFDITGSNAIIITPLMGRVFELGFADDVVFVDTSFVCVDRETYASFVFGAAQIGGLPLCLILHDGSRIEESYTKMKAAFETKFKKPLKPSFIITDDNHEERSALIKVFPKSSLLLSHSCVSRTIWKFVCDEENGVPKSHRTIIMRLFYNVLFTRTNEEAGSEMTKMISSEAVAKNFKVLKFLEGFWGRREDWCRGYHSGIHRRKLIEEPSEASLRVFKDVVLEKCSAFNKSALVQFTSKIFEDYHKKRLFCIAKTRQKWKLAFPLYHIFFPQNDMDLPKKKTNYYSFKEGDNVYSCDLGLAVCNCPDGQTGVFCKHLCAIEKKTAFMFPVMKILSRTNQYKFGYLAFGDDFVNIKNIPVIDTVNSISCSDNINSESDSNLKNVNSTDFISSDYDAVLRMDEETGTNIQNVEEQEFPNWGVESETVENMKVTMEDLELTEVETKYYEGNTENVEDRIVNIKLETNSNDDDSSNTKIASIKMEENFHNEEENISNPLDFMEDDCKDHILIKIEDTDEDYGTDSNIIRKTVYEDPNYPTENGFFNASVEIKIEPDVAEFNRIAENFVKSESSEITENLQNPESSQIFKNLQNPQSSEITKNLQNPESGQIFKNLQNPESGQIFKNLQNPESSQISKNLQNPESSQISKNPANLENCQISRNPESCQISKNHVNPLDYRSDFVNTVERNPEGIMEESRATQENYLDPLSFGNKSNSSGSIVVPTSVNSGNNSTNRIFINPTGNCWYPAGQTNSGNVVSNLNSNFILTNPVLRGNPGGSSILPGNVNNNQIFPGNVNGNSILPGNVNSNSIFPGNVNSNSVLPGNVNSNSIFPGSVNGKSVLPGSVNSNRIFPGNVNANSVLPGSVNNNSIFPGNVNGNSVLPGSVNNNPIRPILPKTVINNPVLPGSVLKNPIVTGNQILMNSDNRFPVDPLRFRNPNPKLVLATPIAARNNQGIIDNRQLVLATTIANGNQIIKNPGNNLNPGVNIANPTTSGNVFSKTINTGTNANTSSGLSIAVNQNSNSSVRRVLPNTSSSSRILIPFPVSDLRNTSKQITPSVGNLVNINQLADARNANLALANSTSSNQLSDLGKPKTIAPKLKFNPSRRLLMTAEVKTTGRKIERILSDRNESERNVCEQIAPKPVVCSENTLHILPAVNVLPADQVLLMEQNLLNTPRVLSVEQNLLPTPQVLSKVQIPSLPKILPKVINNQTQILPKTNAIPPSGTRQLRNGKILSNESQKGDVSSGINKQAISQIQRGDILPVGKSPFILPKGNIPCDPNNPEKTQISSNISSFKPIQLHSNKKKVRRKIIRTQPKIANNKRSFSDNAAVENNTCGFTKNDSKIATRAKRRKNDPNTENTSKEGILSSESILIDDSSSDGDVLLISENNDEINPSPQLKSSLIETSDLSEVNEHLCETKSLLTNCEDKTDFESESSNENPVMVIEESAEASESFHGAVGDLKSEFSRIAEILGAEESAESVDCVKRFVGLLSVLRTSEDVMKFIADKSNLCKKEL